MSGQQTFDIGADVELVAAGAEVHVGGRLVHLGRGAEQAHLRRRERQTDTATHRERQTGGGDVLAEGGGQTTGTSPAWPDAV